MADRYCSVRFKTGEELDKALAAALCSCDDAERAEAAAARAEEIQTKIDETVAEALTQAKESGEFDGAPGPAGNDGKNGLDGYTPQKGVDYWTEADVAEIKAYVDETNSGGITELPDSVPRAESRESSMTFAETPEHHFDAMGNTWWKVSDLTPTTEELLTAVFSMQFGDTGGAVAWVPTAEELLLDTELFTGVQSAAYNAGFLVCRADGEHAVDFGGMGFSLNIPSTGIYFGYPAETAVPETVSIGVSYTEVRKLNPLLLPDGFKDLVTAYIDEYLDTALNGEY